MTRTRKSVSTEFVVLLHGVDWNAGTENEGPNAGRKIRDRKMQDLEMKDRIASDGKWRTRKKPLYTSHIESTEQSSMFRRNKNNYSCKRRRRVASNPVVTVLCIKLDAECDRQATVVGRLLTLGDDQREVAKLFLIHRLCKSYKGNYAYFWRY